MTDAEIRELLAEAATRAADASHVLFVSAQLASVAVREEALTTAESLKVTAAAEAARVVALAAVEVEEVLRKGRATVLLTARITPQPKGMLIVQWASFGTLAMAGLLLAVLAWWLLAPYSGMERFQITSITKTVRAGELYQWTVSYCVSASTPLPMGIERELALLGGSETRVPLPRITYIVTKPCETYARAADIPDSMAPGAYRLIVTTGVQVNPLRTVYQTFEGDRFEVTK